MISRIFRAKYEIYYDNVTAGRDDETISVAVSLFNYERFLRECLDSIAAQTYENLDLIIVDDCSTRDNSATAAKEWAAKNATRFRRATVLKHINNQGLAQSRNTAFSFSPNKAIFVIDADNTIYPSAIEKLSPFVLEQDYGAAYTQLEFFGDQSGLGYADYWSKSFFVHGNYVDAMALISKTAWDEVRGYTHLEGGLEDYDFWCKFIDHGIDAIFLPQVLCRYRVHGTSMLRTDTVANTSDLFTTLTMRHPWLRLG